MSRVDAGDPAVPPPAEVTARRGVEAWLWVFMRVSGVALVFLALAHFTITHILNDVVETDYRFVANRWKNPFWQIFDWLLLVLALGHGANGVRVMIDDYVHRAVPRRVARSALLVLTAAMTGWGTFTIVTFVP